MPRVAAPPSEKPWIPDGERDVEFTMMVVPVWVVIVAASVAEAKMPVEPPPPVTLIVPPLKFTVAVPLHVPQVPVPAELAFKPVDVGPPTIVKLPVALMMALPFEVPGFPHPSLTHASMTLESDPPVAVMPGPL